MAARSPRGHGPRGPARDPGETWAPVHGFPYLVSDQGRVRREDTGRVLSPFMVVNRNGELYAKVILWRYGLRHPRFIHRLVAAAFVPNPGHRPEVNHLDTVPLHNGAVNLEWATRSENEAHKRFMEA